MKVRAKVIGSDDRGVTFQLSYADGFTSVEWYSYDELSTQGKAASDTFDGSDSWYTRYMNRRLANRPVTKPPKPSNSSLEVVP